MAEGNANFLFEAFEKRWDDFQVRFKLYRHEPSEESVHDLRVASRRFLSIIELIRGVAPHPRLQRMRKYYKDQLNSYDELHDTQVMIVEIEEVLEDFPDAEPFLTYLEKREKRLMRAAEKKADLVQLGNLRKRVNVIVKDIESLAAKDPQLNEHLLRVVDDAYLLVKDRAEILDPSQVATIHRLRIAFKKFRYLIEIVFPIVPEFPKETFERMHDLQSVMGEIHDVEVLLSSLEDYGENQTGFESAALRAYFQQVHAQDIELFYQNVACVTSFWRPAPSRTFPWVAPGKLPALCAESVPLPERAKKPRNRAIKTPDVDKIN